MRYARIWAQMRREEGESCKVFIFNLRIRRFGVSFCSWSKGSEEVYVWRLKYGIFGFVKIHRTTKMRNLRLWMTKWCKVICKNLRIVRSIKEGFFLFYFRVWVLVNESTRTTTDINFGKDKYVNVHFGQ
jgi:hypothetical protein